MKFLFGISMLLTFSALFAQNSVSICSWNLRDFGQTKSDQEISFIAETVKDFDILAIQEVVAGYGGAQAVARLSDELNRKGWKWNYIISEPTFSSSYKVERYAYLWKPGRVKKVGETWLEQKFKKEIDREPYYANFEMNGKLFTLVSFHAITKSKQPETEIKYFRYLPLEYPDKNLIFCGDFNCPQSHTVFNPLKAMGYKSVFVNQKTTLRQQCINGDCLASEFDNIFYHATKVRLLNSGVVHFYNRCTSIQTASMISDHIPVFINFSFYP